MFKMPRRMMNWIQIQLLLGLLYLSVPGTAGGECCKAKSKWCDDYCCDHLLKSEHFCCDNKGFRVDSVDREFICLDLFHQHVWILPVSGFGFLGIIITIIVCYCCRRQ